MRALLGLVFIVLSVAAGAQADSYFCVADASTGFAFDKTTKTWESANFDVSDHEYILARSKIEGFAWTVTKVGDKHPTAFCKDDMRGDYAYMRCAFFGTTFRFSSKTRRFMRVRADGYVRSDVWGLGGKEGDNTPLMEIGKCSPL